MLDVAVAAAVLFAGELPEFAATIRREVRQLRAYLAAAGLSSPDERARQIPAGRRSYHGCRASGGWQ
jgi:hypothetical protein